MRYLLTLLAIFTFSFANNLFEPLPKELDYDKDKVKLGRELFYDTIFSKENNISCFSCHHNYGADNKQFSKGNEGKLGYINTPTVFNLPYKIKYFWNGRSKTLKDQLNGPIMAKHEMAGDKKLIKERLSNSQKYIYYFKKAYNLDPSYELAIDALVEFEKTLISADSKFDKYLRGEIKLTKQEKKGLDLFISYGCASCHNGINIGGNSYQKFGSVIDSVSDGKDWEDKYSITKKEDDKLVFIVPSLRNVEKTAPYFHSGAVWSLKAAIKLMSYHNIGVILEESETEDIESFLKTLTGEIPITLKKGI